MNMMIWLLRVCPVMALLIRAAGVDVKQERLPNRCALAVAAASLLRLISDPAGWLISLLISLTVAGILLNLSWALGRGSGRPGMGGGDIKMIFALLLSFAPNQALLFGLCFVCFSLETALLWGRKRFPLGPSLAAAAGAAFLLSLL